MVARRKIPKNPTEKKRSYFVIDTNFLANKFIPSSLGGQRDKNIESCHEWWKIIEQQLKDDVARIYVPDLCIAEAFKVLAKKRYQEKIFTQAEYNTARDNLHTFISTSHKTMRKMSRDVKIHDISTNRDIIISVDRFYRVFFGHKKWVQIVDFIVLATAKYLVDFFDIPISQLYIITTDDALFGGSKFIQELPNAYNPYKQITSKAFK